MIISTSKLMKNVIYALILGIIANVYFFGFGVIIQTILAIITAVIVEATILRLRNKPVYETISDNSAILSAILLAISIPSIAPWWLIVIGVSFAIIFGKQIYGGLGNNSFNPAMVGYVFLLVSYPLEMTAWQSDFLSFSQTITHIFNYNPADNITSATILDISGNKTSLQTIQLSEPILWINIGFLLGGVYLLFRKIIFFHIPISLLFGMIFTVLLLQLFTDTNSIVVHLFASSTMLGAFFIATDPVTASTTNTGRLIYGFSIGMLIIIIRELGGYYPDGIAFAVLLMNIVAPILDTYTKPKTFGK